GAKRPPAGRLRATLAGGSGGGGHRRGGCHCQALRLARGGGAGERGAGPDRPRGGGGQMSEVESELQRILAELDRLNERLAAGELTAAEATEILEQVTQLTSD